MSRSASRARIPYQQCPNDKLLLQEQGASLALSGLWVTQAEVRRARGGGDVHMLMSGMKSGAPRGAIAESKLQDQHRPYHESTTLAAMPRRPPNAALPQSSWSVPSRPTPTRRHGSSAVVAMAAEVTSV
eukprot:scaffold11884_cov107-Phaeocystis_antarctica.AAC.5